MEFKKTVAGISAAAIAVTQVAAVIPMGAFAAEEPVSSGVGFALKLASKKDAENSDYDGVYPEASAKKAVLSAKDITNAAKENTDLYFSYGGLITGSEVGDKYTFTADDLMIVANPKSTTTDATTKSVWDEAAVDLDGTTENGKLTVTDAGSDGDKVVITYTEGADPSIKVSGVETESGSAEDSKTLSFTLDETTAKSFDIVGSGVTVTKIEVTSTRETTLIDTATALTTDGSKTVTVENGSVGDTVVITYAETPDFNTEAGREKADVAVTGITDGVKGEGTYTFKLTDETKDSFTVTGNGYTVSSIKLTHKATEDKTPAEGTALTSTKTPGSVTVAADKLADAVEKGSVKVTYAVNTAETAGSVVIKAGDTEIASFEAAADKTEATVELDAAKAAAVKDNGIVITGKGVTVSKVELVTPGKTVSAEPIVLFQSDEPVVWSQEQMSGWWQGENPIDTSAISDRIGTIEAFGDNFENITVTWSDLTATKTVYEEGELWTGTTALENWSGWVTVGKTDVKKGGKFTVTYKDAKSAQIMIKKSDYSAFTGSLADASDIKDGAGTVTFDIDETAAAEISANGFVLGGKFATVTSIKYEAPASSGEDKKETVLFDGSTDMGTKWGKNETIAKFNAVKGGTITAEFEEGSTEYWQLKFMDSSWEVLSSPKTNQWGSVELGANATKYSFDLNAADAKAVSSNGMIVSGYGITLKKLTYTAPTGEVEEDKLAINAANFPDVNFRKVLTAYSSEKVKNVPVLTEADIAKITDLGNEKTDGSKVEAENLAKVVNFKGIEKLTALKSLTLTNTQRNFKALDLSENAALTFVDVSGCTNLADLKLPETAAIEMLLLQKTAITAVDVSKYTGLKVLNVSDTKLTALDVKANTELETLALANVKVAELDVKANTKLRTLDAANCGLTKIDVSANTLLEDLDVSGNSLITLDLTGLTALTADKFKADNNKRNIGTVVDNTYDLKDLVADGLDVDKMTITTEGVTRNENVLTDVKGDVTYTYETGLEADGLDKVTFTLAPEKVTSENFEVSYMDGAESKSVVCETWDEVLKAMTDKNVEYSVTVKKDVTVDKLTMPTAAKAKSVTVVAEGSTITTKSASVTLPTDTWLINVKIKAVDKDGKTLANTFTLNASKDLKIAGGLEIEAKASTIKGGARSVLKTVQAANEFDSEITGFGTVRVDNGAVTFNNTVKVKELDVKNGSVVEIGKNAAVTVTNITSNGSVASKLVYTDAEYKPVAVTGNITGNVKLEVGIKYKKTASAEDGQEPTTTTVSRFAKDDVVLVSKNADLAAVDASESLPEGATLARDKSDIKVMDTVATMNGVEYAQWSDITSTIAAAAKADKNAAKTAVYNITLSKELDAKGALKMPAAGTFGTLIIRSDADAQTLKFTGNLTLTGKTIFENVKLESDKIVNKVATAADFSISAGKNELTLNNVTTADKASIKTITSSGVVNLDRVTVGTVNAATVNVTKTTSIVPGAGAVNGEEKTWEGKEVAASSVTVNGNLTAKTALNLNGENASLTVKGILNAMSIEAEKDTATLAVYTQPRGKNALVIGKNGVTAASKSLKFVLVDYTTGKTAHITEDVVLGTIAGTYADEFIPSNDNLDADDSYYILKSGKNLIAKSKDAAADYVNVKINGKTARYKTVDEAIKEISATGKSTDVVEITITGTTFTGAIDKLPLPTAGKYKTLTYKAADAVAVKVTGDLALTGNLVLDNVDIEKVTKDGKSTAALNVNVGKYELYANGCYLNKTADAAEGSGEYSAVANISGTGKFTTGIDIVVSGKVNGITLVLQNSKVTLDGDSAAFTGSIEANRDCTFSYTNAKNVKFVNISSDRTSSLKLDGTAVKEDAVLASITGDYTKDAVVVDGDLKVVRSGNSLKAVKAENVVEVKAYKNNEDFENKNIDKVRAYDSVASAMNDISRIKDKKACYEVAVKTGDVLVLPKANTYSGIELTANEAAEITTARDLTLTGNLRLNENITLNKADKKAMTVKLGSYALIIDKNAHVAYDAEKKVSQFVNIDGSKGAFFADGDITVSGKVNVDHFKAPKATLGDKASFTAANIITEGGESLDYNVNIANKVKIGNILGKGNIVLNVDGEIADKQIAVLTGNYVAESVTIGDGKTYVSVPKGNKLMAVAKADAKVVALTLDGSTTYLFDTYENAVKAVANLGDAWAEIEIDVTDVQPVSGKLTLPTNGKYKTLTITSDKAVTLKVNSDITLTGNLVIGGKVTLQKKEGTAKDLLKFKSATDKNTKKTLYTVTVVDNAKVVNGTVNGEPIVNPEPTEPEPVQKETVNGTLPYSGSVDLSTNVLKIAKTNATINAKINVLTVTLQENVTSAIVIKDANGDVILSQAPAEGKTTVSVILKNVMAEAIIENGFTIEGEAGIVTGVTCTPSAKETEVNASIPFSGQEVDLSKNILKIAKTNVAEGNAIIVTLKANVTSAIVIKDADGKVIFNEAPAEGETTVSVTLTTEAAKAITENGFTIEGEEGIVTGVTSSVMDNAGGMEP